MKKALILFLLVIMFQLPSFAGQDERAEIYYTNGVTYFKDKKYSSAILEFKKVLRTRPYDKTAINALGTAYLARAKYFKEQEHSYKKAINDLRSAVIYLGYWNNDEDAPLAEVEQTKSSLEYLKRMYAPLKTADEILLEAKSLRAQGELAASIYEYRNLFEGSKYQITAYQTASDIYKSLNNEKMAIECIRKAVSVKNDDGVSHFKYAVILDEIGNEDAAIEEYQKALEFSKGDSSLLAELQNMWMAKTVQNPKDSQALINLGAILQKEGHLELAKEQYKKARQINPNDPVILINLASVLTELKDYDNAIRIYDEMLSKNPADLSARFYKGKLYERKDDIASAIKQYKEILSLKSDDPRAKDALNSLLSGLSEDKLSGYLYNEAINNPQDYDAQFKYAFEMHKNKKYSAAIEFYKKAIALNKNTPEPFINLAQIFIEQKDYQRAKNVIAHGLSILPDHKELLKLQDIVVKSNANDMYARGSELYENKDYEGALNAYLSIPYQTKEILMMIGNCYYELQNKENAIKYYNKVLETSLNDENALYMIANVYIQAKDSAKAKEYLNKVLSVNSNNKEAKDALLAIDAEEESSLLNSAIGLYEEKKYDEALVSLEKLIAKNKNNAYAHYYKGAIFEEKGETDRALLEYKASISSDANFALGYYMTAVLLDTKEKYNDAVPYYEKYIALKAKEGSDDEFLTYAKSRVKELKDYLSKK